MRVKLGSQVIFLIGDLMSRANTITLRAVLMKLRAKTMEIRAFYEEIRAKLKLCANWRTIRAIS